MKDQQSSDQDNSQSSLPNAASLRRFAPYPLPPSPSPAVLPALQPKAAFVLPSLQHAAPPPTVLPPALRPVPPIVLTAAAAAATAPGTVPVSTGAAASGGAPTTPGGLVPLAGTAVTPSGAGTPALLPPPSTTPRIGEALTSPVPVSVRARGVFAYTEKKVALVLTLPCVAPRGTAGIQGRTYRALWLRAALAAPTAAAGGPGG